MLVRTSYSLALLLILFSAPVWAGIVNKPASGGIAGDATVGVHTSAPSAGPPASTITTGSVTTTAGSAIVCGGTWSPAQNFTSFTSSVTCTSGWANAVAETNIDGRDLIVQYCVDFPGGSSTFTLTVNTTTSSMGIACVELKAVNTSGVFDVSDTGQDTTPSTWNNDDQTTVTTTADGDMLVGWSTIDDIDQATCNTPSSCPSGGSWVIQEVHSGDTSIPFCLFTCKASTAGSVVGPTYLRINTNGTQNTLSAFKDTN